MYPPERQQAIAEYLVERPEHRAGIAQISERLGVTAETVRKDLDVLERRGVLRRVRGGAELLSTTPFEQALAARHAEQFEDKLAIARRVVAELPEDGVVIFDSGSLTFVCAQLMPTDRAAHAGHEQPAGRALPGGAHEAADHDAARIGPRAHVRGRRPVDRAPAGHDHRGPGDHRGQRPDRRAGV